MPGVVNGIIHPTSRNDVHYNDLIPELGVLSFEKSLEFYQAVLGFTIEYSRPENGFAFLSLGGSQLMIEQVSGIDAATKDEIRKGAWRIGALEYPFGRGMSLSIHVDDLDSIISRLTSAGHALIMEPSEAWYRRDNVLTGERHILVADPDGYLLRFQESLGEKPVE